MSIQFGIPMQIQEFKAAGDEWLVEGYAAAFGNVDHGYDVIMPGAFDRTLADGHKVRFHHSHDPRLVLGLPKKLKADKKGLFGQFRISKTTLGSDTRQLVMDGALDSFSIGYSTKDAEFTDNGRVRQLIDLDLHEVSLVSMPMNDLAQVTAVKDFLAGLGITAEMTLAEKVKAMREGLGQLLNDTRGLVDGVDRPLSQTKRHELTELLEMFSGLDAVRSDLTSVLAAAPIGTVAAKRLSYELAERRQRLRSYLEETI